MSWSAVVDFPSKSLLATATLTFDRPGPHQVELDMRGLQVTSVDAGPQALAFAEVDDDRVLGPGLTFDLPDGVDTVVVTYRTTSESTALQWASPEQTLDGTGHFLYSQCQTIHARSLMPLHDSMSARITFDAVVEAPAGYAILMAADLVDTTEANGSATARYSAVTSRPPYLLALAVGHMEKRRIGPRSEVWAEPSKVEAAAWEFAGIEAMLQSAEELLGPYRWGKLDLLVMPPSYPYGGLENPGLVFLAPSLVAGDRSLTDIVVHEIAHHWSGNLVTAASMEHFWINEGFTTHAERRITEATSGRELADLRSAMGLLLLREDLDFLHDRPELSRLRMHLEGLDPDATSTWVAHEKGSLFIRALEEGVGRSAFDTFLRKFFVDFAFRSLTTEQFVAYAQEQLPDCPVEYDEWLNGEGLPASSPVIASDLLHEIRSVGQTVVEPARSRSWDATAWSVYLAQQGTHDDEYFVRMDEEYDLTHSTNPELHRLWLLAGVRSGYQGAIDASAAFLGSTGRMKYLKPMYDALIDDDRTRDAAVSWYLANRSGYHPIARNVIEDRFARAGIDVQALATGA